MLCDLYIVKLGSGTGGEPLVVWQNYRKIASVHMLDCTIFMDEKWFVVQSNYRDQSKTTFSLLPMDSPSQRPIQIDLQRTGPGENATSIHDAIYHDGFIVYVDNVFIK